MDLIVPHIRDKTYVMSVIVVLFYFGCGCMIIFSLKSLSR
ncbi:MAG: hypothetical protein ACI93R_003444 [Flavobacteriales bacterium]